jgi:hypothetical protein
MKGVRGFSFNALTAWVPGILLVLLQDESIGWSALVRYAFGYIIFISMYELGYLANDTWGLRKDETPRRRICVDFSNLFFLLFVCVRVAVVILLASLLGILDASWFHGILIATILVIALHNLVTTQSVKFITFIQMSAIRFSAPVLIATGSSSVATTLISGLMFFALPRLLTYQYSKGRLNLPERTEAWYALANMAAMGPMVVVAYALFAEPNVVVVWMYFLLFQFGYFVVARGKAGNLLLKRLGIKKAGDASE